MIIRKLVIYGFGKHENVSIDLENGINVLYGQNEAGKTTIQQFLLHILFGFPQKNHVLQRYEPKTGGKYGGQVHIDDPDAGRCIIERVRGKSAGAVTVRFEDGSIGGEETLRQLLRHYDRSSFESIFSFSLLQLQGFEKMDEEQLSRTLLASGTTGVDALLQLEAKLEKEMGELFKKNGRIPEMNVKLAELREMEKALKEEREQADEYAPAVNRMMAIDRLLDELKEEERRLEQRRKMIDSQRQVLPLIEKEQVLSTRLEQLAITSFPTDGIRRYEMINGKLLDVLAKRQVIQNELEKVSGTGGMRDQELLIQLERLVARETEWHQWRSDKRAATEEIRSLQGKQERFFASLGIRDEEKEIRLLEADVSIQQEKKMLLLLEQLHQHNKQLDYLTRQLTQVTKEEAAIEQDRKRLEETAPSEEERRKCVEWPSIQQRLAEAKAFIQLKDTPHGTNRLVPMTMLLMAVLLVCAGILSEQWIITICGVLLGAVATFLYTKVKKGNPTDAKRSEMEQLIAQYAKEEALMDSLIQRVAAYLRKQEALENSSLAVARNKKLYREELRKVENGADQTAEELFTFLQAYGFEELPSLSLIPEIFRMIRELQEVTRDLASARDGERNASRQIAECMGEASVVLGKEVPGDTLFEHLRNELMVQKERMERQKANSRKLDELHEELKLLDQTAEMLHTQREALLTEAAASSEEKFYQAFDVYQEAELLKRQMDDVRNQLSIYDRSEWQTNLSVGEVEETAGKVANRLSEIAEQQSTLLEEKVRLAHLTRRLADNQTYEQMLQQFENKRAEFTQLASKWSSKKAVAEAIRQTMAELKEKKLPGVLRRASHYFSVLTGESYIGLSVGEEGFFRAIRQEDNMLFPIMELSQATKEQAYISLRLALAESLRGTAPFPIIMDDPFVHFDGIRLSRMIKLLKRLQAEHQFIYFTCHETMMEHLHEATIITVSDIGNNQGAVLQ
ncbi:AAA family ATPase [Sporosarcina sp. Te-1]|uniref:ATP-binding protein n=1 Tax=Sporosarcina sp. Te-1 TaxID=2818390 RepID=UPI001A9E3CD4|nr:AAA family ATPase [Sporosarcina sp. Te-1]QTD42838.1 AAA family ATPase [Sporosarcina sp. Te-1]